MYTPKSPYVYVQGTSLYTYVYIRALLVLRMRGTGLCTYIYIKAHLVGIGVYTCIYIKACIYIYIHKCIYVYTYIYIKVHVYTYIYIKAHLVGIGVYTYMYIYIHKGPFGCAWSICECTLSFFESLPYQESPTNSAKSLM